MPGAVAIAVDRPGRFTAVRRRAYEPWRAMVDDREAMTGNRLVEAFLGHRPALLRYLRARGAGNEGEDLLQELWLKVEGGIAARIDDPLAYLYRMAHNLMLDRVRESRRRRNREQAFQDGLAGADPASEPATAERALIARERLARIDRALATLGPRTDMIFRRHRIERVPQQQIAAELGLTLSAIEKHLQKAYRAIAALQRNLLAEDREEAEVPVDRGEGR